MKINIFGSTGIIGNKSLYLIDKYFPNIKINLLCANNNVTRLINQTNKYSPKYVYLHNKNKYNFLKNKINPKIKILNLKELELHLLNNKSDYTILAISGYKSLNFLELILQNTLSLGLVNKESIVSAGHLFKKFPKNIINKIYPLDSEHFSIYKNHSNNENNLLDINKITLTASGGPFLGRKYNSLKNISVNQAKNHPKWNMGFKNSIDSATLTNKCLEIVEAHYLFDIPYNKLDATIHPESKIHSIIEYKNYIYKMIMFHNDMAIPIYHFLNQNFNYVLKKNIYSPKKNNQYNFYEIKNNEFPIFNFFKKLDKTEPSNIIKFNVANEYAVNLFKNKIIKYTDIYKIIVKITSLNLNYKLNNIKSIIEYHKLLERKISEKNY